MRLLKLSHSIPILLLIVIVSFNCSEETPTSPPNVNTTDEFKLETTVSIGTQGGIVSTDEFSLTIPAGSFSQQTELKLYSKKDSSLFGEDTATKIFKLAGFPSDFSLPLHIAIKYTKPLVNRSSVAHSEEYSDELTGEKATIYGLNYAADSSGFLVSDIFPHQNNTGSGFNKISYITDEIDKIFTGITNRTTYKSQHFLFDYGAFYDGLVQEFAVMLEKNYSIIADSLKIKFSKDDYDDSLYTVLVSNFKGSSYFEMIIDSLGQFIVSDERIGISSSLEFKSGTLLLSQAATEHKPQNYNFGTKDFWWIHAFRYWTVPFFSPSQNITSIRSIFNLTYPFRDSDAFNEFVNLKSPFLGIKGVESYPEIKYHFYTLHTLFNYLFNSNLLDKKDIGEIFYAYKLEQDATEALIEKVKMPKGEWWPDYLNHYITSELSDLDGYKIVPDPDGGWEIDNEDDKLKVFTPNEVGQYLDFSAKRFRFYLNDSTLTNSSNLHITIAGDDGSNELTTIVYSYKSSRLNYLGKSTDGSFVLSDLKDYYDNGIRDFLFIAVNSRGIVPYTNMNNVYLTLEVDRPGDISELDYTKCWAKVKLGTAIYSKTNLTTGSTFNSSTSGQSFGQITYEGSFSNNKFVGYYDQINTSGSSTDTISGTISVDLNEDQNIATDVRFTQIIKNYNSNLNSSNFWDIEFNGKNISLEDENDPSKFVVKGNQTCSSILSLDVFHRAFIPNDPNNNYEETLQSFQCDLGGEEITIYFSK